MLGLHGCYPAGDAEFCFLNRRSLEIAHWKSLPGFGAEAGRLRDSRQDAGATALERYGVGAVQRCVIRITATILGTSYL